MLSGKTKHNKDIFQIISNNFITIHKGEEEKKTGSVDYIQFQVKMS